MSYVIIIIIGKCWLSFTIKINVYHDDDDDEDNNNNHHLNGYNDNCLNRWWGRGWRPEVEDESDNNYNNNKNDDDDDYEIVVDVVSYIFTWTINKSIDSNKQQ